MTANQLRIHAGLTVTEFERQVREMIDQRGWSAVKRDPVLGPIVHARLAESKTYVDTCVDVA